MNPPRCNLWFGPGGLRGVFGAGVAEGLERAMARGDLDPSRLRLFGSSIGCLNAAFLASGNTGCGLSIFEEETRHLLRYDNLLPSLVARLRNRLRLPRRGSAGPLPMPDTLPVPAILDVDHVFRVMARRAPRIVQQLRDSPVPVYGEVVELPEGRYRHVNLGESGEPLEWIRCSLHCFPFYWDPAHARLLDSGIHGPGFVDLLRRYDDDLLVVILNTPPDKRKFRHLAANVLTAVLAASPQISRCYLGKHRRHALACRLAGREPGRVLLEYPKGQESARGNGGMSRLHALGLDAAERIVHFVRNAFLAS
jgi:predicted acylesterase/phospholipase RssA